MDTFFTTTRSALAKAVSPCSSLQFPAEPLDDAQLLNRCCFSAHLPGPYMGRYLDVPNDTVQATHSYDCLQNVSALVQANHNTLWLLKSQQNDASRTWHGLKPPQDMSIIQAKFYADEQGVRSKNDHRIVLLVRRGGHDEVWLVDDAKLFKTCGIRQSEPRPNAACIVDNNSQWSNDVCESAPLLNLRPDDIKVIKLARGRSKCIFVSGCRGVACVLAEPSFLTIYDLEDVESEEENSGN